MIDHGGRRAWRLDLPHSRSRGVRRNPSHHAAARAPEWQRHVDEGALPLKELLGDVHDHVLVAQLEQLRARHVLPQDLPGGDTSGVRVVATPIRGDDRIELRRLPADLDATLCQQRIQIADGETLIDARIGPGRARAGERDAGAGRGKERANVVRRGDRRWNDPDQEWSEHLAPGTIGEPGADVGTTALYHGLARVADTLDHALSDQLVAPCDRNHALKASRLTGVDQLNRGSRRRREDRVGSEDEYRRCGHKPRNRDGAEPDCQERPGHCNPLACHSKRGRMTAEQQPAPATRLTQATVDALGQYAARATWPAGFVIYQRGAPADGLFVVTGGRVVLRSRVRAGRGFIPWIATPLETFGAEGLSSIPRYATEARADDVTTTLFLSSAHYRAFVREQPQHATALIAQVLAERAALLEKLRELTTMSVEQRLVTALLRMAAFDAFTREDGALLLNTARYRLLCELVGATRESVSLVLSRLTGEGVIERKGNNLVVVPARLIARIEAPPVDDLLVATSTSNSATTAVL